MRTGDRRALRATVGSAQVSRCSACGSLAAVVRLASARPEATIGPDFPARQSERGEASGPAAVRLFSGSMNWWYLDLGPRGVIFAFGARDAATRLVKYRLRCRWIARQCSNSHLGLCTSPPRVQRR